MGVNAGVIAIVLVSTLRGARAVEIGKPSCDIARYKSLRSEWSSVEDACQKKMSFELWALMKAEGNANDADAQHVRAECIKGVSGPLRLELITPEDWDSTTVKQTCGGKIASETKSSALFLCDDASDLEVFCADEAITSVSQIVATTTRGRASPRSSRRLQSTTSEAGVAHKVAELIAGLEALGCQRTTGEDQNVCVMSDSYNVKGGAQSLQASGDLPPFIDVVKEGLLVDENGENVDLTDEGSAMMELVYDIASGANFKFNTAFGGIQAFADDVLTLATDEACDVIVDDVSSADEPGFRDGVLSRAVDTVSDRGTLFFTSAGNDATAARFTSNLECVAILGELRHEDCEDGVATLVMNSEVEATDPYRYMLEIPTCEERIVLTWDEDGATSRDMAIVLWYYDNGALDYLLIDSYTTGVASEYLSVEGCGIIQSFFISIVQLDSAIVNVDMLMLVEQARLPGFDAGSIYGHRCASKALSVTAMDWQDATGAGGAFDDPETASVTYYASRGPCTIDSGSGIELQAHPVTTAATDLQTSTAGFEIFPGTSASAPVAAAIATLIRAACYPNKRVTYTEIMEMLTNYDYAIDVTSDADGAAETWGAEAGYGIISADQMLLWVAENCRESCPGAPSPGPATTDGPAAGPVMTPTPEPVSSPSLSPAPLTSGECRKADLSEPQRAQLAVYDKDIYVDNDCVSGSVPIPLLCNYMGIGQECRGCYMTCDGANKYKHDHAAEVATWDEYTFFNFCPNAEVAKFQDC